MASFGKRSSERVATCHPDLQKILHEAIKMYDFTVLCGHRGKEDQNNAFAANKSNKQWPDGRHNSTPATAVDIAPWPIDWDDVAEFHYLAGIIMAVAEKYDIKLTWGGRWTHPKDCPHFQLTNID